MAQPANLLQLQNGTKSFGIKTLFSEACVSINESEHIGVIGPNGAGKTTLFKVLIGQDSLDSGEVIRSNKLRVGYLEQEVHEPPNKSADAYLDETSTKPLWELRSIGKSLGLKEIHFSRSFQELSGGYRMRMKLLALIGREPNLMLLDEPTNFLDLESVMALENFLQSYDGAFLLISHDREFLRRTTDHTLEVEQGEVTKFPGNIDDYFEQKTLLREVLQAQMSNQDSKRKRIQDFIARFGAKATKAKQAQSRMKALEKMERIEMRDLPVRARIRIPEPSHTGKESLRMENADLGYQDQIILRNVNLRLERGSHVGVVGFNGVGKSTLLKSLGGRIPLIKGRRELGYQVSVSYFAQHVAEELDPNSTVFEEMSRTAHPEIKQQEILNLAGCLLFSGDDVQKSIRILSGGEKSRVALGQILLKRSPLLLLDEPTNHLDFDTVEAMTEALRNYTGTVVVVSHDRGFIGRIANKILEIRNGGVELYPGSYDDYLWSLERGALQNLLKSSVESSPSAVLTSSKTIATASNFAVASEATETPIHRDQTRRFQAEAKELQKQIAKSELGLAKLLAAQEELNKKLLKNSDNVDAEKVALKLGEIYHEIQVLEEKILTMMDQLASAEAYLRDRLSSSSKDSN
jgi:ATP-binding cassette subfamily F protein 3